MRLITTLPDEPARRFADYLSTLKIDTRLLAEAGGQGVWVCDEDRLAQAKEELARFLREPASPRYDRAVAAARAQRRREEAEEEEYRRLQKEAREQLEESKEDARPGPRPLTFAVMAACVLVALMTGMGRRDNAITRNLQISVSPPNGGVGLHEVRSGELWRLVTPSLLHFEVEGDPTGLMHIAFNLMLFLPLAGQVESLRGTRRLAWLLVVLSITSNLVQYYLGGTVFESGRVVLGGSAFFGGLSGVVYGLFGYVWMKSRTEPNTGYFMAPTTVVILLGWLFVAPLVDKHVAGAAHAGGLFAGLLIGLIPAVSHSEPEEDEEE